MKTTICTIIVLLALHAGILTAGGIKHNIINPEPAKMEASIDLEKLAPATPAQAEFADASEFKSSPAAFVNSLAPAIPLEADFEDTGLPIQINMEKLSPLTPKESDFEDID